MKAEEHIEDWAKEYFGFEIKSTWKELKKTNREFYDTINHNKELFSFAKFMNKKLRKRLSLLKRSDKEEL